jgi:C1A family cysteine protease
VEVNARLTHAVHSCANIVPAQADTVALRLTPTAKSLATRSALFDWRYERMSPMDQQEILIAELKKENEEFRQKLLKFQSLQGSEQSNQTEEALVSHVVKENEELKEKLLVFKKLEEDLMAQRVSEKAKKQLTVWLTIGGIVISIGGIVGYRQIEGYTKELVRTKVQSVADEQIKNQLLDEGRKQVAIVVEQQKSSLHDYVNEQIKQIVGLSPISVSNQPSPNVSPLSPESSATSLDYTPDLTPVRDQGDEGGVVGFATAAALEYQIKKKLNQTVVISTKYLYYFAQLEGGFNPHADTGANIKDAIKVLSQKGAVAEDVWPYKAGDFGDPPTAVNRATKYRIAESRPLSTDQDIRSALQKYGPVVAGITWYDSFDAAGKAGILPDPKATGKVRGSTAICIVGYDDAKKLFKFKHCWGPNWGDKGYGYLPYDYVKRFVSDTWAISL